MAATVSTVSVEQNL